MSAPAVIRSRWAHAVMIATPLLVLLAILAVRSRAPDEAIGAHGPFVPELRDRLADLARLQVLRGDETTTIERRDGVWVVAERDDHSARIERVQELVRSLAGLERDQPMTGQSSRHADLGLAWPDPNGEATLVRLFVDDNDAPIAEIVLGRDRWSPRSQYVRHLSESQTWRVFGAVIADAAPIRFVDDGVARLPADRFERIDFPGGTLRPDERGDWNVVEPATASDGEGVPPLLEAPGDAPALDDERREAAEWVLPELLSRLDAEDIRRDRGEPAVAQLRYHLDGLGQDETESVDGPQARPAAIITVDMIELDGDWWMRVGVEQTTLAPDELLATLGAESARWDEWLFRLPPWREGRVLPVIAPPEPTVDRGRTTHVNP